MSYDFSGRDETARLLKGILGGRPDRLDPAALEKRDSRPERLSRAMADALAKVGIGVRASSGIEVEAPRTQAANGVWSDSIEAVAKALRAPHGRLHELSKDWRDDLTISRPSLPPESTNAMSGDAHGGNGARWARDVQADEYGSTGAPKPTPGGPPHSAWVRNPTLPAENSDVETFKSLLAPKNAKRMSGRGFED
jgi:hypothetical protein